MTLHIRKILFIANRRLSLGQEAEVDEAIEAAEADLNGMSPEEVKALCLAAFALCRRQRKTVAVLRQML